MRLRAVITATFLTLPVLPAVAQNSDGALCAAKRGTVSIEQQLTACDRSVSDAGQGVQRRANTYVQRASIRRLNKDNSGALADYSAALELDPKNIPALLGRAMTNQEMRNFSAVIPDIDKAQSINSNIDLIYLVRSAAYMKLHRYDEAIADADHGSNTNLLGQSCLVRAAAGRELDKARAACDRALRNSPNQPTYLNNRGLVGLKQKLFQAAWVDFNAALKVDAHNSGALYGRGIAALRLGRDTEGQADLATAQGIQSDINETYADFGINP